jgi:hypothetical protein
MKNLAFITLTGLILLSACSKVKVSRQLPAVGDGNITQLSTSQIAWINQMAKVKQDSINKVDSLAKATGVVDQTSLFHKKNLMVSIVEVNDHYFPNMNCYVDQNGKPVFDLAIAFAANINLDPATGKPYVQFNPEWQAMLRNGTFKVVQRAGISVGMGLLGNWDAAGWSNFTDLASATAFAQIVAFQVRTYGFQAVFSDDEYSVYNPQAAPNSYVMVMSEIKRLLPDIFLVYYTLSGDPPAYNGKRMGDVADAGYGDYGIDPSFPVQKTLFGNGGSKDDLAQGVLGFCFFNVGGNNPGLYAPYVQILKGTTLTVPPMCMNPNETDFINGQ